VPVLAEISEVTRIDVLRMTGMPTPETWPPIPGEIVATLSGAEADALLAILAQLPDGEQMRCFIPSHGFRAWTDGRSVAEMAICFKCNNGVILRTEGSREWFKFDAQSDVASSLSHTLSKYGPEPG
jgi:hypothetical protein